MITMRLRRSTQGIIVFVKAHEAFERYFKSLSGESSPVSNYHREWTPLTPKGPLQVWDMTAHTGIIQGSGIRYRIDVPGYQLMMDSEVINMSFLRLVGVSSPEGISFEVKGAFTRKYIQNLVRLLMNAGKWLYIDFLKPVDIMVTVNAQEN